MIRKILPNVKFLQLAQRSELHIYQLLKGGKAGYLAIHSQSPVCTYANTKGVVIPIILKEDS